MSATMSGDTPSGKLFSRKFRFLDSTLSDQTPCKYWSPSCEENMGKSGEKRGKKRPKRGNLGPSRSFQNLLYLVPRIHQKHLRG